MIGDFRHRRGRGEAVVVGLGVKWMHDLAFMGGALVFDMKVLSRRLTLGKSE
jgi:hypothetical protein